MQRPKSVPHLWKYENSDEYLQNLPDESEIKLINVILLAKIPRRHFSPLRFLEKNVFKKVKISIKSFNYSAKKI